MIHKQFFLPALLIFNSYAMQHPNSTKQRLQELHLSIQMCGIETIEKEATPDLINEIDENGYTPLFMALLIPLGTLPSSDARAKLIEKLLQKSANPNAEVPNDYTNENLGFLAPSSKKKITTVFKATRQVLQGNIDIVSLEKLLQSGGDCTRTTADCKTSPYELAKGWQYDDTKSRQVVELFDRYKKQSKKRGSD